MFASELQCLGNHEFIDGEEGVFDFLKAVNFPVVTANVHFNKSTSLLKKSHVISLNGTKVGIVGAVTPQTRFLSSTKYVDFQDEVEAIK